MSEFVNPTKSQSEVYVNQALQRDISESSRSYEELKFRPDRVENFLSEVDATDYISEPNIRGFGEYDPP